MPRDAAEIKAAIKSLAEAVAPLRSDLNAKHASNVENLAATTEAVRQLSLRQDRFCMAQEDARGAIRTQTSILMGDPADENKPGMVYKQRKHDEDIEQLKTAEKWRNRAMVGMFLVAPFLGAGGLKASGALLKMLVGE